MQGVSTRKVTETLETMCGTAAWKAQHLSESFTAFCSPPALRHRLRSTNMLQWVNKEIRRRTRVAGLFPNEQSLPRLVSAVLVEINEEWET